MDFISYAQNFEDIMLWRALQHVKNGFYIDVGANDPNMDSVTKAFYLRGWNGINIEPVTQWHEALVQHRPNDINLCIAVGAQKGALTLYNIPDTGLATHDHTIAQNHGYSIDEIQVDLDSLTNIIEQHGVDKDIHFLKVDVEGFEGEVIKGIDLEKHRPWIILVESTQPNSQEESFEEWDEIIVGSQYKFVYFDGLNRFYLAQEHEALETYFQAPPNVFDNFYSYHFKHYYDRSHDQERHLLEQQKQIKNQSNHIIALQHELNTVLTSKSWRLITKIQRQRHFIRSFRSKCKHWLRMRMDYLFKKYIRHALLSLRQCAESIPFLKKCALRFKNYFPSLSYRFVALSSDNIENDLFDTYGSIVLSDDIKLETDDLLHRKGCDEQHIISVEQLLYIASKDL